MGGERKEGRVSTGEQFREALAEHDYRKDTTVAELVALLRMGRELAEASRDIEVFRHVGQGKMERATDDVNRILGQYDAAIAKHGGGQ